MKAYYNEKFIFPHERQPFFYTDGENIIDNMEWADEAKFIGFPLSLIVESSNLSFYSWTLCG